MSFEEIIPLFTMTPEMRGRIRLDLDEAYYLYKTVKNAYPGRYLEIGRFLGGSTLLIARAMGEQCHLTSIDNHINMGPVPGRLQDKKTMDELEEFCSGRYNVLTEDSTRAHRFPVRLIFIDGDHTYDGVKADYDWWIDYITEGGHILFHDAAYTRPSVSTCEEVWRFITELNHDKRVRRVGGAGSIAHFKKLGKV